MTPERFQKVEKVFDAVADAPAGERAELLDTLCAGDAGLRAEVASLLVAAEGAPARIQGAIGREAERMAEGARPDGADGADGPRRLGPYRLVRELGRGGMGVVYLGVRDDDEYRTEVAVKLLHGGLLTAEAVARFRDERQILATLEHPGIVRLLDGGRTEERLPYLVMERVLGEPITRWAEARELDVRARILLFQRVCAAVAYAHQKLVVHRDLKPGNVLVTADGQPKLLDFGIAKLLDPEAGREAATRTGMRLLTPEYASPEQIRGDPVSTATDVYALGAVLYELLSGAPAQRAAGEGIEALRAMLEAEPPRPSQVAPEARRRALAGDLDNIVRKALEKEAGRRYASVEQLSEDLGRHLNGLPVLARAGTWTYRVGKLVRRNRGILAAAGVVLASLSTATVVSVRQARRADEAARRAEARTSELILAQARLSLDHDPTAAVAWLATYGEAAPGWETARLLADTARHLGVALHVLPVPDDVSPEGLGFAGDGRRLLAVTNGTLRAWDTATGAAISTFPLDGLRYGTLIPGSDAVVAASRAGELFVVSADGGTRRRIGGVEGGTAKLAVSDDGRWAALAGKASVVVAAVEGGEEHRLDLGAGGVSALTLSRDGARVAAVRGAGEVRLWEVASGRALTLEGRAGKLVPLLFAPGGGLLVGAGEDGAIFSWDVRSGAARVLRGHATAVRALAISADGARLASADRKNQIRVWDLGSGADRVLGEHRGDVLGLRFAPDGKILASTAQDQVLRLWDLETGEVAVVQGHPAVDAPLAFSPDGRLLATAGGGQLRVWRTRGPAGRSLHHEARATQAIFSPDGRLVGTCAGRRVTIWDAATGEALRGGDHDDEAYGIDFSPDSRLLASAGHEGTARLWSTSAPSPRVLRGHDGRVTRLLFSPDGRSLVTAGYDGTLRLWDPESGAGRVLGRVNGALSDVAFSPDGERIATVGVDNTVRLWDPSTGAPLVLGTQRTMSYHLTFLDQGRRLLVTSHTELELWDTSGRGGRALTLVPDFEGHALPTPDGRLLVLASGGRVVIRDLATGEERVLPGEDARLQRIRLSHDGRRLLTGSVDGAVRLWDLQTSAVRTLHRHAGVVFDVSFSADDRRVASASVDQTAWTGPADDDAEPPLLPGPREVRGALATWTTAKLGEGDRIATP